MSDDSGSLAFVGDCVNYESAAHSSWRLEASSIRLIGEFTNQSGPAMEDYFFVFFRRGENDWYEASACSAGREDFLRTLMTRFPGMAEPGLWNSADFKSRVLWPAEHAGKPMFDFRPMTRGNRWHARLLDRVFPPFVVETVLRPEFAEGPSQPPRSTLAQEER